MKNSKKLKLVLMILICVLIILVGFGGIYSKGTYSYKNILPNYGLASDLNGITTLEFEVDEGSNTIYYDKEGNEVDSTTITEENKDDYTKTEVLINAKENLTTENYKMVLDIMSKRLEFLQVDQYELSLDDKTGKIVLAFEDDYPEDITSILPMEAKFELVDSNTEDVILNYNDLKSAEATYATVDKVNSVVYIAYINLKLNNSGMDKINNIESYKTTVTEDKDDETEEKSEKVTVNSFKVMFDGEKIAEVSYDDISLTGKTLRITTADNLTSDSDINTALNTNTIVTKLATMGKMPVIYNITAEEYIVSDAVNYIDEIVSIFMAVIIISFIVFIIKYRLNGILTIIAFSANIALFLLIIRLTHIQISLNGFAGMFGLLILNVILTNNILKCVTNKDKAFSENIKDAYLKSLDALVIMLIIFTVFAFSNMTVINSMGLLVFWGWLVIVLGNLSLTVPMLSIASKK